MKYKIEKGINPPSKHDFGYPFDEMEIGDSFFIKCNKSDIHRIRANFHDHARRYRRLHEQKRFTTRQVENGLRCWRVK